MKVILQDYEPRQRPFGDVEARKTVSVRKSRIRFNPVVTDSRLFHAL